MTIKEARLHAGLTQQQMSDLFQIPKRTIENWEAGDRKPPAYVEKLLVEKLTQIATEKKEETP
jgi:DNA-binding transcriptional regulator YiaG